MTVTGRGGPWSCETSRFPNFLDNRLIYGGKVSELFRKLKRNYNITVIQKYSERSKTCIVFARSEAGIVDYPSQGMDV
jgi:hypothetical protein